MFCRNLGMFSSASTTSFFLSIDDSSYTYRRPVMFVLCMCVTITIVNGINKLNRKELFCLVIVNATEKLNNRRIASELHGSLSFFFFLYTTLTIYL